MSNAQQQPAKVYWPTQQERERLNREWKAQQAREIARREQLNKQLIHHINEKGEIV